MANPPDRPRLRCASPGAFVELFALSAIAIGQPLLDVTAQNREVLVTHGTRWAGGIALALLAMIGPPVLAWLIESAVGLVAPRAIPIAHAFLCGGFIGVVALEIAKHQTRLGPAALIAAGLVATVLGAVSVARGPGVRQFLRYLAVAAIAFPLLFLAASPATGALAGDAAAHPGASATARPTRVVLVILDELPTMSLLDGSGRVDRGLFPHLGALADHSTWYRNDTTVAGFTQGAVPAILTGRYPTNEHALPIVNEYPKNIFTLLNGTATINGHEAVTRLCPSNVCHPAGQGFDSLVRTSWQLWTDFARPRRSVPRPVDVDQARASIASGRDFVKSLHRSSGPHLDVAHLEVPHFPWERLPSLQRYDVPSAPPGESYAITPLGRGAETARMRHLLQVQAADTLVGNVTKRLQHLHEYDHSMVIVTADHGVAFTPGAGVRNASPTNLAEIMWTPLFVKYPGQQQPVVDERRAASIDIVPTIADVMGVKIPWPVDGHSLIGPPVARPMRRLYPWIWLAGPTDVTLPPGKQYIDIPGDREYQTVLHAAASRTTGDSALRIFRTPPYGGLVGRAVSQIATGPASSRTAAVDAPARFAAVDLHARPLPWVWNAGSVQGASAPMWIGVAVNGRIAAVTTTLPGPATGAPFTFLIPPSLARQGKNRVELFEISGAPTAVVLHPMGAPGS